VLCAESITAGLFHGGRLVRRPKEGIYLQLCVSPDLYMNRSAIRSTVMFKRSRMRELPALPRSPVGGMSTAVASGIWNEMDPGNPRIDSTRKWARTLAGIDIYGHLRSTSTWGLQRAIATAELSLADTILLRPSDAGRLENEVHAVVTALSGCVRRRPKAALLAIRHRGYQWRLLPK